MSSKIEVSRELFQYALNAVEYLALRADDIGTSNIPVADSMRALLAAPVVEHQPAMAWALLNGNGQVRDLTDRWDVAKHWDGLVQSLYDAPPELAELQATIARLTALCVEKDERMSAMNHGWAEAINQRDQFKAEIERLKGGQGEPVAWEYLNTGMGNQLQYQRRDNYWLNPDSVDEHDYIKGAPLYREPPAPVSVLPDDWKDQLFAEMERRFDLHKQIDDDHMVYDDTQIGVEFARDWIAAFLDKVKEMNR